MRIFQGGTDAVTRVLIESGDGTGERWTTVGVSPNIIDASFQALDGFDHLPAGAVRSHALTEMISPAATRGGASARDARFIPPR